MGYASAKPIPLQHAAFSNPLNRPPPDNTRTQNNNTKTTDNRRSHDNPLLDQTNRRPATDRHAPRNSASMSPAIPASLSHERS